MRSNRAIKNLALIGFMGVGKTSVGRLVAMHLGFEFLDTDDWIEEQAGKSISRIFADQGEPVFREWERLAVAELAGRQGLVIATGGGLPTRTELLETLKGHALVICLWASPEMIWERVRHQSHRPLLQTEDPEPRVRELLAGREAFYRQADVLVNTEMRSAKEVAHQVIHHFHSARGAVAS